MSQTGCQRHHGGNRRCHRHLQAPHRGFATLWTILALPAMILMIAYAIEAGRLHLARQELLTALESAALAGAKTWCESDGSLGTEPSRQCAIDFAAANNVLGSPLAISANFDAADDPNENSSCGGDLLYGTITDTDPRVIFDAGMAAGCGNTDGPNAHATRKVSTNDWQTVTLCERDYECMVVVATPQYDVSSPPAVVRIRNTGTNSFEYFVQETNTGNALPNIPVHFFIAEAGVYTEAADGVTMEVVKFDSTVTDAQGNWNAQNVGYMQAYTNPVTVGQVMTYNDPDWSVFWTHGGNQNIPPGANLYVGKHVGQDGDTTRADETLGYVVIEGGAGTINGLPYYAELGPDTVQGVRNAPPYNYATPNNIGSYVVATKSAEVGGNGAWALLYGADPLNPGSLDLALDEHTLTDRRHTTEPVSYILFGGPCAVCATAEIEVPWLLNNFFGCSPSPTTLTAKVTAMYDCETRCARLICVDEFVCP